MANDENVDLDETIELDNNLDEDSDDDDDDVGFKSSRSLFTLKLKDGDGGQKAIPLVPGLNRIGRDHNRCRIVLRSPSVSKLHAVIEIKVGLLTRFPVINSQSHKACGNFLFDLLNWSIPLRLRMLYDLLQHCFI